MEKINRNKYATREQLIGAATAIFDYATSGKPRESLTWEGYENIPVSQLVAPLDVIGIDNERVRNLCRDLNRKYNYDILLNVVGNLNYKEITDFYYKMWWQIRMNHLAPNCRERFGVDMETFARMIRKPLRTVVGYESFHEFMNDYAMIYAFEQTAEIMPPKIDEFRRKFNRAVKEYHANEN